MQREPMVSVENLTVRYGNRIAVDSLSFTVPPGNVLAVLGPNGAGKTTLIKTLATLIRPSSGKVCVAGHDAARNPDKVRRHIALTGQSSAIDPDLTVTENLIMIGRLFGHSNPRRRGSALVAQLELADIAGRRVADLSGGNQRRADLALSLVSHPSVLFLDEPTTGLDPRARSRLWETLSELTDDRTSLILTTQYLEEADRLADEVLLLDAGRAVATGSPSDLKQRIGGHTIKATADGDHELDMLRTSTLRLGLPFEEIVKQRLLIVSTPHLAATGAFLAMLGEAEIRLRDIEILRPTLDDVFLKLTTGVPS